MAQSDWQPDPPWPDSYPCDYCGAPVEPRRRPTDPDWGTVYRINDRLGAWHWPCDDALGGPHAD